MNFRNVLFSFILSALFLFAMISFAIQLGTTNSASTNIQNDPMVRATFGNLSKEFNKTTEKINNGTTAFETEAMNPITIVGDLIFGSIRALGTVFSGTTKAFFGLFRGLGEGYLGIPSEAVVVIYGLLTTLIIFLIWKFLKTGE